MKVWGLLGAFTQPSLGLHLPPSLDREGRGSRGRGLFVSSGPQEDLTPLTQEGPHCRARRTFLEAPHPARKCIYPGVTPGAWLL